MLFKRPRPLLLSRQQKHAVQARYQAFLSVSTYVLSVTVSDCDTHCASTGGLQAVPLQPRAQQQAVSLRGICPVIVYHCITHCASMGKFQAVPPLPRARRRARAAATPGPPAPDPHASESPRQPPLLEPLPAHLFLQALARRAMLPRVPLRCRSARPRRRPQRRMWQRPA